MIRQCYENTCMKEFLPDTDPKTLYENKTAQIQIAKDCEKGDSLPLQKDFLDIFQFCFFQEYRIQKYRINLAL